jgi:hypothetical protein
MELDIATRRSERPGIGDLLEEHCLRPASHPSLAARRFTRDHLRSPLRQSMQMIKSTSFLAWLGLEES